MLIHSLTRRLILSVSIMLIAGTGFDANAQQVGPLEIDQERVAANGIRRIEGKHVDLYTDLPESDDPESDDIAEMTEIFDQAVPQWADYFGVDQSKVADWKLSGFLMNDRAKFVSAGLWLDELPQFLHGYQLGPQFWLDEQPSLYYRRHLMLHEGTHGFMNLILGGSGPPWYSEGMAELIACHSWQDGKLKIGYRLASREESEYWGRVKVVQDTVNGGVLPDLEDVMTIGNRAFLNTESYAWAWAATAFLDGHPRLQQRFRSLQKNVKVRSSKFQTEFLDQLKSEWGDVQHDWQLFIGEMDYGFDIENAAVVYQGEAEPLTKDAVIIKLKADRGWQSTGHNVQAGQKLSIRAAGRYQVGKSTIDGVDKAWISEPDGITLQYHRGQPLGAIMYAIRSPANDQKLRTELLDPLVAGRSAEAVTEKTGEIFVRVNDGANSLHDNAGEFDIKLQIVE